MVSNMFYLWDFEISGGEQFQKSGHFGKSNFSLESCNLQGQNPPKSKY